MASLTFIFFVYDFWLIDSILLARDFIFIHESTDSSLLIRPGLELGLAG